MTRSQSTTDGRPWILLFIAVCLVAANMRMTITGVGPLLELIADDQGVSPSALGMLASLPLIGWGVFSAFAHALSVRIGLSRAVSVSLVVLIVGTVWRSLPGAPLNLWAGTALIGAALAVGNVLLPAVVKRDFAPRLSLVMGVYTALLGGMGAVSAGIVVPIAQISTPGGGELGWRVALLTTGALLPVALVVWMLAMRGRDAAPAASAAGAGGAGGAAPADGAEGRPLPAAARGAAAPGAAAPGAAAENLGRRIWRDRLAWCVAFYMGTQSLVFYMLQTWLAPIETSFGRTPLMAGIDVMIFQICGVGGSMLLPVLYRGRLRRTLPMLIPAFGCVASAGIVLLPALMPLWLLVAGLAGGASLSMALTLTAVRARDPERAGALSGMAQTVGYLLAAVGPMTFGWLHEVSGGWLLPLALLMGAGIAQLAIGFVVGRERYVLPRPGEEGFPTERV